MFENFTLTAWILVAIVLAQLVSCICLAFFGLWAVQAIGALRDKLIKQREVLKDVKLEMEIHEGVLMVLNPKFEHFIKQSREFNLWIAARYARAMREGWVRWPNAVPKAELKAYPDEYERDMGGA